jgi:hypothetical protein
VAGVEGIHARPPSRGPSPVTRRVTRLAAPAAAVGERGFNAHMDASLSAEALELVASLAAQQAATEARGRCRDHFRLPVKSTLLIVLCSIPKAQTLSSRLSGWVLGGCA